MEAASESRKTVEFNGKTYWKFNGGRYYYRSERNPVALKALHRDIWESVNGPIPPAFHVHHLDGDAENNDPSNLECLPESDHYAEHFEQKSIRGKIWAENGHLARIREIAKEWHQSPEGRAWHSEHSKRNATKWITRTYACKQCGKEYQSRAIQKDRLSYCSRVCKAVARIRSGIDDVDRACLRCGKVFRVYKHMKKRTCSISCGAFYRWSLKKV